MVGERIYLYDTTLRDGAQTQGVSFSYQEKDRIARALDDIGIDYIEGGWPGANPTDDAFFANPPKLVNSVLTAFGMTRRSGRSAGNDPGLVALIQSSAQAICLVGKSWDFQVEVALGITHDEYLRIIEDSIAAVHAAKGQALFDAEHFFDGFKANPVYAIKCLKAAVTGGARWIVLCDTNGGTLPDEIERIVKTVAELMPDANLGIHCHNDTGNAIANSLAAVRSGARMVQGTLNGLGERCGNADLVSIIPTLMLKMGHVTGINDLTCLTEVSRSFDKHINHIPNRFAPYVGSSAFAHKGGLHAAAVEKNSACYEHIDPALVGNKRTILISDQAGRSNVQTRLRELGIVVEAKDPRLDQLVELIKQRDVAGYAYDEADASFEMLVRRRLGMVPTYFKLIQIDVNDILQYDGDGEVRTRSLAVVRLRLGPGGDDLFTEAADGNGPVHALDLALRKVLEPRYPIIKEIRLEDFRVNIINAERGTDALPQVLIRNERHGSLDWWTLGVSPSIIEASVEALLDAFTYELYRSGTPPVYGVSPGLSVMRRS
ncbi:MAG: citramalate synthase [Rhodospirillaceae bacterium]